MFVLEREKGHLALILHAHLPFVRHPEHKQSVLEEFWFFEAMNETYLPLIQLMEELQNEGVPFCLTLVLSPTLTAMFQDPLLNQRFLEYMEAAQALLQKEEVWTRGDKRLYPLAQMYQDLFHTAQRTYHRYGGDLTQAFSYFCQEGFLELMTCAATHAYLPLMRTQEGMRAQLLLGVLQHQEVYGHSPRGIWLPECGYTEELDPILKDLGLEYFCMENHGILYAHPRPRFGTFAPIQTPHGMVAFGRDLESSKQVWSAEEGYPGDVHYREFYRDIGYQRDPSYLGPFFFDGIRKQTGIKYHRITGKTEDKDLYHQEEGQKKAREHAHNFLFNRRHQLDYLEGGMAGKKPLLVAPYDAELFGHWWFEGPIFLKELLKEGSRREDLSFTTPSQYLETAPPLQIAQPISSSWGYRGYHEVWLEGKNDWIYRHLHQGEERMKELAQTFPDPTPLQERALNQSLRELLLAQSSDWPFIMKTGTMVEYATRRVTEHLHHFLQLFWELKEGRIREEWLTGLEEKNPLFPALDYRIYAQEKETVPG